ncbi:patatin-like phospholipase family protein [Caulobacter sp. 17J80-11]|nr:patatin-like phospholipase family protein [Caulobacter sp. 17J80-11]
MPVARLGGRMLAALVVAAVAACASPARLPAVPTALTAQAQTAVPNARYFPSRDDAAFRQEALTSFEREKAWLAQSGQAGKPLPPVAFLAVSGGGDDGAFGAGLLVGWTERGDRPEFKGVTGVSTGALIAPFAFLGPKYDHVLKETYTDVSAKDIFSKRFFTAALFSDAMASTAPMHKLVDRYVNRALLDEIAAEYAKGRLLMIGTTDLDSREPVVWNMTAIAASKDPKALDLFRRIMVASASIPGAFPPVMIDVTVDGKRYQEMHVDGGATRQVFLYPPAFNLGQFSKEENAARTRNLYIIRNARLDPEWASVDRRTLSIADRAVSSLIATQGIGDLDRIYLTAKRDGLNYNLAYIPREFDMPHTTQFDTHYMRALFDYGHAMAVNGYPWAKYPPDYGPPG